jgi:hypothetical protein
VVRHRPGIDWKTAPIPGRQDDRFQDRRRRRRQVWFNGYEVELRTKFVSDVKKSLLSQGALDTGEAQQGEVCEGGRGEWLGTKRSLPSIVAAVSAVFARVA